MVTIKELSEQLGVSPQTIRRYVKKELGVAMQERKTLQLDATQAAIVADHFCKNKQGKQSDENDISATFVAADVAELLRQVATLSERVAGLERENSLLRERLEVADSALEREQMQARGFWSRLGQKLLGSGEK